MTTAVDVIQRKRDGHENSPAEIRWLVERAVSGDLPEYQTAAWLMAAFLQGLSEQETVALTRAFVDSGRRLRLSKPGTPPVVDKHSTGGVGDKTSLVVAPLLASAGLWIPMISGRGLGFTGGTLDKLEAIPGYRSSLELDAFTKQVQNVGVGIVGATSELAPGDRIFYRIRDVTATVESIPLIVASILSKKLAEDLDALVLDVKVGNGALMKTLASAEELARALVETGKLLDMQIVALLTDMSQPLGMAIGNALEVAEAIETLRGEGPDDFTRICVELSGWLLHLSRREESLDAGRAAAEKLIESGRPFEVFQQMIAAQGADVDSLRSGTYLGSPSQHLLKAVNSGTVSQVHAENLGRAALRLGAGRKTAADSIDPTVGILLHKKVGDLVKRGDPLATLYYNRQSSLDEALELAVPAFEVGSESRSKPELIYKVVK